MTTYNQTFYDTIRAGCQSSAAVVAPLVHGLLKPTTVVDVGCGEGWWAKAFEDLGCAVEGVDGGHVTSTVLETFTRWDLTRPLCESPDDLLQFFPDLVVCLEVAEHLPPERAVSFVADLVSFELKPKAILFSAAIPGQGGVGHINCQWQSYWAALIEAHGYKVTGDLRKELWHDERVEPWYRQNLLLAIKDEGQQLKGKLYTLFAKPWPLDLVHPEIWRWYR